MKKVLIRIFIVSLIILVSFLVSAKINCPNGGKTIEGKRCDEIGLDTNKCVCNYMSPCNRCIACDDYFSGPRRAVYCYKNDYSCKVGCFSPNPPSNTNLCTIYNWSEWGIWSECNSSGKKQRIRYCTSQQELPPCEQSYCFTLGENQTEIENCTFLENPYFANLSQPNVPIATAELEDTILLRFPGINILDSNITYYVEVLLNESSFTWYNPYTWFGGKKKWFDLPKIEGTSYEPFTISEEKIHRIKAFANSENSPKFSYNLTVLPTNNKPPFTNIISPKDNYKGTINCPIKFEHDSRDEDDLLKITWDFGDGNETIVANNYSKTIWPNNENNINHSYNNPGPYKVTLKAEEESLRKINRNRPSFSSIILSIYREGINVIPVISSPKKEDLGNFIRFDASQSYILNCSKTLFDNWNFSIGEGNCKINCSYILAPDEKKPRYGKAYLRWKYSEDNKRSWNFICPGYNLSCNEGNWEGIEWNETNYNILGGVNFTRLFTEPKERWFVLEMNFKTNQ